MSPNKSTGFEDSHLCVGVFSRWAVAEVMEVVAVNQTVLSLSAPLHTSRLFIPGICVSVSEMCCVGVGRLNGWCFSFTGGNVQLFVLLGLSPSRVRIVRKWYNKVWSGSHFVLFLYFFISVSRVFVTPCCILTQLLLSPRSSLCLPWIHVFCLPFSFPVIPLPQAFPVLVHQSKQPPQMWCHNHNEHVEFS